MRPKGTTNGTLHECIYIRNKHNYVSGCGMRAPGHINYWKYCPFCRKMIFGIGDKKPAGWFHTCTWRFEYDRYRAECEPDENVYNYKNWTYCPFCSKRIIDLSREGDRGDTRD